MSRVLTIPDCIPEYMVEKFKETINNEVERQYIQKMNYDMRMMKAQEKADEKAANKERIKQEKADEKAAKKEKLERANKEFLEKKERQRLFKIKTEELRLKLKAEEEIKIQKHREKLQQLIGKN